MRILGIDPGYGITGFGLIETGRGNSRLLQCGAITTPAGMDFSARLEIIYEDMRQLLQTAKPDAVAIEELFFGQNVTTGYDTPTSLGTDRIVGMASAYHFYGGPLITIDFGTATTFNLIDKEGRFFGGAIAPGVKTGAEALVNKTAKLPHIELIKPDSIVGKDTRSAMQAGIICGYAGLVKYMVDRYKSLPEMKGAKVVATGGLSELISQVEGDIVDVIDRALALKGLNFIYHLNKDKN